MIGVKITSWLAHQNIEQTLNNIAQKYTLDDLCVELVKSFEEMQYGHDDFCFRFLCLRGNNNQFLSNEHEELYYFIEIFYPELKTETFNISRFPQKILNGSLNYWREKIAKEIGQCKNLVIFADKFGFQNDNNGINLLNNFICYLVKYKHDTYLNNSYAPILPNQNEVFVVKEGLFVDTDDIDELFKDICKHSGDDIRNRLLHKNIYLQMPLERTIGFSDISDKITKYIEENANNHTNGNENLKEDFRNLFNWFRENKSSELARKYFKKIIKNIHWLYDDDDIAINMKKAERLDSLLDKYGVSNANDLEEILKKAQQTEAHKNTEEIEITRELLAQYGISSEESLQQAIQSGVFGANFVHNFTRDSEYFNFVYRILARAIKNVIDYLSKHHEYDLSDKTEIAPTIFVIKKNGQEIYLIVRPSDYEQVIIYYESEFDMLDYEKDWELWIEDGKNEPQKLTFGKILKLTGMNRIPLRKVL
jgi:hypothetical protein